MMSGLQDIESTNQPRFSSTSLTALTRHRFGVDEGIRATVLGGRTDGRQDGRRGETRLSVSLENVRAANIELAQTYTSSFLPAK